VLLRSLLTLPSQNHQKESDLTSQHPAPASQALDHHSLPYSHCLPVQSYKRHLSISASPDSASRSPHRSCRYFLRRLFHGTTVSQRSGGECCPPESVRVGGLPFLRVFGGFCIGERRRIGCSKRLIWWRIGWFDGGWLTRDFIAG